MDDQKTLDKLLSDDVVRQLIKGMKIENEDPAAQARIFSLVGELVMQKVTLELLKRLPKSEGEKFEALIGSGDMQAMRELLEPHIPHLDAFIQEEAKKEFELLTSRMEQKLAAK